MTDPRGPTVLTGSPAFSGFSVDDPARARALYEDVLGRRVSEVSGARGSMLRLHVGPGEGVFVYTKPGHTPASFTVLNFPVPDVPAAVDELTARGVRVELYDGQPFDERGVMIGGGPLIAWFTDPAGNVFAVIEQT
jgi:predicted enzyme related to lactoylglutathione lyase